MNVTAKIVCYKSKTLANGEHPLRVRICKDGKKKYKSLGVSVNPKYWNFDKNATEIAQGINAALHGADRYSWFIN